MCHGASPAAESGLELLVLPGLELLLMVGLVLLELLFCRLSLRAGLLHDFHDRVEDAFHVFPDTFIEIVQVAITDPIHRVNIGR